MFEQIYTEAMTRPDEIRPKNGLPPKRKYRRPLPPKSKLTTNSFAGEEQIEAHNLKGIDIHALLFSNNDQETDINAKKFLKLMNNTQESKVKQSVARGYPLPHVSKLATNSFAGEEQIESHDRQGIDLHTLLFSTNDQETDENAKKFLALINNAQ